VRDPQSLRRLTGGGGGLASAAIIADGESLTSLLGCSSAVSVVHVHVAIALAAASRRHRHGSSLLIGSGLGGLRSGLGLIELGSSQFRTVSASARITANGAAGHVALSLGGNSARRRARRVASSGRGRGGVAGAAARGVVGVGASVSSSSNIRACA
jgi:D-serine deaminase-like pyridoxal phosphate-dependent protein